MVSVVLLDCLTIIWLCDVVFHVIGRYPVYVLNRYKLELSY